MSGAEHSPSHPAKAKHLMQHKSMPTEAFNSGCNSCRKFLQMACIIYWSGSANMCRDIIARFGSDSSYELPQ